MKSKIDLVRGWIKKAESDLTNAKMCVEQNQAIDTACFHAQQAAEKLIKAYLVWQDIDFPYIHSLEKLIELCAQSDPSFQIIKTIGQELTPYAVELRYDDEFWPSLEVGREAFSAALQIRDFVMEKFPLDVKIE